MDSDSLVWLGALVLVSAIGAFVFTQYWRDRRTIAAQEARIRIHRTVIETAIDAIITISELGNIVSVNPAAEKLFGYCAGELEGRNIKMLMPEPDSSNHDKHLARYLETGERKVIGIGREVVCKRSDNTVFPADLAISEISGQGAARFAGILRDRSEYQEQMHRIQRQQERLAHANRVGTLGEMAAGMAHEINQPLTAIAIYAQAAQRLLVNPVANQEQLQAALVQIDSQAHRAGDVIRRMRVLAKGEPTGRLFCRMNELIAEIMPLVKLDARHRRVLVTYELGSDDATVFVDKVQIQQVILNFVRNGIDAMAESPLGQRHLVIGTEIVDENRLRVAVRDHGHGVPTESVNGLFHPFFTTKTDGMGMGLSISKSIISAHGGVIGYEHPTGGGARFWFTLEVNFKESSDDKC